MIVHRLRFVSGNLIITIPKRLRRQLGWAQGQVALIEITGPETITIRRLEVEPRNGNHIRTHPDNKNP